MQLDQALQFVPTFVLVFFRVTGLAIFAPLFGSERIPRRVKLLLSVVLAAGLTNSIKGPPSLPSNLYELSIGIGGEILFGLAMGMILSFTFIAAQWAGEMIGQQMGLNMSEVLDPQFGGSGSLIGNLYFMFTLVIFLIVGGHREMIRGVRMSFDSLPLLSLRIDQTLLDTMLGLLQTCTMFAVQLAAPMLVTMLVVDLALGCIGKAMPQMNILTAGLSVRSLLGVGVLLVGLVITKDALSNQLLDAMNRVQINWSTPQVVPVN